MNEATSIFESDIDLEKHNYVYSQQQSPFCHIIQITSQDIGHDVKCFLDYLNSQGFLIVTYYDELDISSSLKYIEITDEEMAKKLEQTKYLGAYLFDKNLPSQSAYPGTDLVNSFGLNQFDHQTYFLVFKIADFKDRKLNAHDESYESGFHMVMSWAFKFFQVKKGICVNFLSAFNDHMRFLFIDDKEEFRHLATIQEEEQKFYPFYLEYYNHTWQYQDYKYCKVFPLEPWQIRLYQQHAIRFDYLPDI